MRYVIDLNQNQVHKIMQLTKEGRYQDVQQFISAAVENQVYLENSDNKSVKNIPNSNIDFVSDEDMGRKEDNNPFFHLERVNKINKTLKKPEYEKLGCSINKDGKFVKEEHAWLWGQINRIFPVKLGLRVLSKILENDETVELDKFRNKAADEAVKVAEIIREDERNENKNQDEKISAGLPKDRYSIEFQKVKKLKRGKNKKFINNQIGSEVVKSKDRYKNHFLGYARGDGLLEGAMPFLRFVNIEKNEGKYFLIGITKEGLEFSKLKNPVLDNKNFDNSLSDKEINFYLRHISRYVKGEAVAIKWILDKIKKGIGDRRELINELREDYNSIWQANDAFVNTQRAGLTARISELKLIRKERDKKSVNYAITERGKKFIS